MFLHHVFKSLSSLLIWKTTFIIHWYSESFLPVFLSDSKVGLFRNQYFSFVLFFKYRVCLMFYLIDNRVILPHHCSSWLFLLFWSIINVSQSSHCQGSPCWTRRDVKIVGESILFFSHSCNTPVSVSEISILCRKKQQLLNFHSCSDVSLHSP